MSDAPKGLAGLGVLVVEAGFVTLYLSVLVYIAGWSYADRYFADLGLNISAVDGIGTEGFSFYALWVFKDALLMLLCIGVILVLSALVVLRLSGGVQDRYVLLLALILVVGSIFGAAQLGKARGAAQASALFTENYGTLRRVLVYAKPNTALAEFLKARDVYGKQGCLRKIFMDQKMLYAYPGFNSNRTSLQPVLMIPLSEVGLIETLTDAALCPP